MKKLLIPAALLAASVALVACGGGGSGGAAGGSATAAMPTTAGNAVSVKSISGTGSVLVDSSGQALYASDQESASGKVMCTGACTQFWMPAATSGGVPKQGPVASQLAVINRPDGTKQITYKGMPLYSFTQDQPGQVTGDGFHDAFNGQQFSWHVVTVGNGGGGGTSGGSSSSASGGGSLGY
jgi:predicted lipoprotein with Yx(FWY)xxD motif